MTHELKRIAAVLALALAAACGPAAEGIPSAQAVAPTMGVSYPSLSDGAVDGQVFEYY